MVEYTAKLYFKNIHLANINGINYSQPWLYGKHNFFDKQLLDKLVKISQFSDSKFWTDDSISEDEQDQKLDNLQLKLGLTDDDLSKYYYVDDKDWTIILSDNDKFEGFPRIDEEYIEWR